jgi:hypothetical protein
MEQIYRIKRNKISELLNHIDEFKERMDNFVEDNSSYDYNIELKKGDNEWIANLSVTNKEEE